jgi:hypothetical protein
MRLPILVLALTTVLVPISDAAEVPQLTDVTEAAGIVWQHSIGDDALTNIVESTGAGCVFFDSDGDGDLDIYLVNGSYHPDFSHARGRNLAGKLANALYRNDGDGTFTDVTEAAGVGDRGYGMGAVAADYDNDGDSDLFVTNYGRDTLFENDGDGSFSDVTDSAGVGDTRWTVGAAFFDFDRDGLLDLYVGAYLLFDPDYRHYFAADGFPGPLSYQGRRDTLYRNRGDGTFEDVSESAGIDNPDGRAMGIAACDIDDDGHQDIFVANDGMENYLWHNRGDGRFENIALATGTAFGQNGEATSAMGPEFGDFDLDGLVDLFVPDMGYGCLYRNTGKGWFEEKSARLGVAAVLGQYTSWSGNFLDIDNDGWLDIFVVNGDAHHLEPEEDTLFVNRQNSGFDDVSAKTGKALQSKFVGRGSASGDFDNDGDLDILVLNLNDRPRLLRNDLGKGNHWLELRLVGTVSNRDAVGARVRLTAGGRTQLRDVRTSSGYLSQSDPRLHFGLGSSAVVERIEISWPSGTVQRLDKIAADRLLTITEPEAREKTE